MTKDEEFLEHLFATYKPIIHSIECAFTNFNDLDMFQIAIQDRFTLTDKYVTKYDRKIIAQFMNSKREPLTTSSVNNLITFTAKYPTTNLDHMHTHSNCDAHIIFYSNLPNGKLLNVQGKNPLRMPDFVNSLRKQSRDLRKFFATQKKGAR